MFAHTGSLAREVFPKGKKKIEKGPENSLALKSPKKDITETEILILHFIHMANLPSRHRLLILATYDLAAQADLSPNITLKLGKGLALVDSIFSWRSCISINLPGEAQHHI